jgi:hypothetical protein
VHDYALYVEDDRYSIPTLLFVTTRDATSVRRLARQKLRDSPHHLSVAVFDGDQPLFKLAPPRLVASG